MLGIKTVPVVFGFEVAGRLIFAFLLATFGAGDVLEQSWQRIYGRGGGAVPAGQDRKSFYLGALFRVVLQAALATPGDRALPIARALGRSLEEKHLLIWLKDPAEARILANLAWDGRIDPVAGADGFGVVDTTVSYAELNAYIEQQIDYAARLNPDGSVHEATLTITYTNRARELVPPAQTERLAAQRWDARTRQLRDDPGYWGDYLRVYLPAGSRILEWTQLDSDLEYAPELGRSVVAGYFGLRPGETRTVRLTHVPPPNSRPGEFTLDVRKQPGARPAALSIRLEPMPGARIAAVSPDLRLQSDGAARAATTLTGDRRFAAVLTAR